MNLSIRLISTALTAVMVGQSAIAFGQSQPAPVQEAPVTTAERAQENSQAAQVVALGLLIQQADKDAGVIEDFNSTLAQARLEGADYVARVNVDTKWMEAGSTAIFLGAAGWAFLKPIPKLKGFEAAKQVNPWLSYLRNLSKPAKALFIIGAGVTIAFSIAYEHDQTKIEMSKAEYEGALRNVQTAERNYDTKVEAIKDTARHLGSQITEHDRVITINGLNFPNLRYLQQGGDGGISLKTFPMASMVNNDDGN